MSNSEVFQHVGKRVEQGTVLVTPEDVELFRLTALEGVKMRKFSRTETQTTFWMSSFTSGAVILRDSASDYDVPSLAFYSKTVMESEPDYGRSTITFARYSQRDRNTKIYNIYDVESQDGEATMAVRRVRILRDLSRIAFNEDGEPYDDVYSHQRKVYEVPMTSDDVVRVARLVDRITRRAKYSAEGI